MAIRIPTSDQSKIFLGSQEIGAVYVGANKVWPDVPAIDPDAFIMRISVSAGQTVTIPFYNATGYNGTINWKDGTTSVITSYNDTRRSHTYAAAGEYDLTFSGNFPGFYFYNADTTTKNAVIRIMQWGNVGMTSMLYAFYGCVNLSQLPASGCAPSSMTTLTAAAYFGCSSLTSALIPSHVTTIGNSVFHSSGLTEIVIPSTVSSLGQYVFYNCQSLVSAEINASVTILNPYLFYNCISLSAVILPDSLISISKSVFQNCTALTIVDFIPNSVTTISAAFGYCTSITSVILPSSLSFIGGYCFFGCTAVLFYYLDQPTVPSGGDNVFYGINQLCQIKVPSGSVSAYKSTYPFNQYSSYITSL